MVVVMLLLLLRWCLTHLLMMMMMIVTLCAIERRALLNRAGILVRERYLIDGFEARVGFVVMLLRRDFVHLYGGLVRMAAGIAAANEWYTTTTERMVILVRWRRCGLRR
uniref:Putative secreted peptide n=1 Tax=Anopheles braziliensis TaxID=58242 RepID=A0A2M3ZQF8_9DIPT